MKIARVTVTKGGEMMEYFKELRKFVGHRPLILPGAVVLIINEQNEVLLQHRIDGNWGLPGGLMELAESLEGTAAREVEEETGLKVTTLELVGVFSGPEYYMKVSNGDEFYSVTAVYATKDYSGDMEPNPDETQDLRFYAFDQLPSGLSQSYRNFIEAYLVQQRQ
ncbi:NUDIX hydrolase [Metaplanococcus flavidus]|uniref:NUDIX hydrolase n=1 Tax=Metaplanococcus flavidus TaxID=569883 RepID=A0ABW3LBB5_9BACL